MISLFQKVWTEQYFDYFSIPCNNENVCALFEKQREPATAKMMNRLTTVPSPNWFLPYLFLAAILEKYRWGFQFGALVVALIHRTECPVKYYMIANIQKYQTTAPCCMIFVDCCILVYQRLYVGKLKLLTECPEHIECN